MGISISPPLFSPAFGVEGTHPGRSQRVFWKQNGLLPLESAARRYQWIGLYMGKSTGKHRKTSIFPLNMGLSCKFSLKPIH